jgi:hypothetical protein
LVPLPPPSPCLHGHIRPRRAKRVGQEELGGKGGRRVHKGQLVGGGWAVNGGGPHGKTSCHAASWAQVKDAAATRHAQKGDGYAARSARETGPANTPPPCDAANAPAASCEGDGETLDMTARGSLRSTTLPSSRWLPMTRCTDLLPAARPPRRQRAVKRRSRRGTRGSTHGAGAPLQTRLPISRPLSVFRAGSRVSNSPCACAGVSDGGTQRRGALRRLGVLGGPAAR